MNPAIGVALLGLGSNALSNIGAKKREQDKRFFDMQMEHSRRQYDQRMWGKVTRYNHPLQQMARLKAAGLNPNLIYGSSPGSAVGNAQQIAPGKQIQGQAPPYHIDNPGIPFMDAKVKQAQSDNMEANALHQLALAKKASVETRKSGYEADFLGQTIDKRVQMIGHEETVKRIKAQIQQGTKQAQIDQMFSNLEKTELQVQALQIALEWQKAGFGGSLITQIAQSLGMDLRTAVGKAEFKTWAKVAGFLKAGESISNIGRNVMSMFNPLKWGKPKAPKGTYIKNYYQR